MTATNGKPKAKKEKIVHEPKPILLKNPLWEHRVKILVNLTKLTPREKQVFNLMIKGLTNEQIWKKLGIARKTLDIHRENVWVKFWSGLKRKNRNAANLVYAKILQMEQIAETEEKEEV